MLYLTAMKAHTLELRERIVGFVKKGGSKTDAARIFNVGRKTVYRYLTAAQSGRLAPLPCGGSMKKLSSERLEEEVAKRPDATLKELGKALGVNHVSVWRRLRQLSITLKKKRCATANATIC